MPKVTIFAVDTFCPFFSMVAYDAEPPVLIDENRRLVATVADDGMELVEIHGHTEILHALRRNRVGDRLVHSDRLERDFVFLAFYPQRPEELHRSRSADQLPQSAQRPGQLILRHLDLHLFYLLVVGWV